MKRIIVLESCLDCPYLESGRGYKGYNWYECTDPDEIKKFHDWTEDEDNLTKTGKDELDKWFRECKVYPEA